MAYQALVPKEDFLPAGADREAALLERADVRVGLAQIELIAERRARDGPVPALDARVLRLDGGREPGFRREPGVLTPSR